MNINTASSVLRILLIIIFTVFIARKTINLSLSLLKNAGCILNNYRGNPVIFGMGIAFIPIIIVSIALTLLLFNDYYYIYMPYLFVVCAIGIFGLLDDLIGKKEVKGLRNHIAAFLTGELTTGFIKAFIGLTSAIVISLGISKNAIDFLVNVFNIALFTNALNLMDLRPGRCIKTFLSAGIVIFFANFGDAIFQLPLLIMLISAMVYIDYDLKELCMLGDTGSNILGITLGYFCAIGFDTVSKTFIFLALATLNLIAERFSITKIISNNRLLNYLDSLGRSSS